MSVVENEIECIFRTIKVIPTIDVEKYKSQHIDPSIELGHEVFGEDYDKFTGDDYDDSLEDDFLNEN